MAETKIEWTEQTWNPIAGCSIKSPGCAKCYAMPMARRHELMSAAQGRVSPYAGLTKLVKGKPVWTGDLRLVEAALAMPLNRSKPTVFFVNSMSDLFHEDVPEDWIAQVFAVMAMTPQHTYQVLTKRSDRMRRIMFGPKDHSIWHPKLWHRSVLPNVWLGVSAEDQTRADERVPDLLATPAAVRFVSAEPLLGPINFSMAPAWSYRSDEPVRRAGWLCPLNGDHQLSPIHADHRGARLDWIIVGGESGRDARPMHPDWARDIRDQCEAAQVPFFFKQWGAWAPRGPESMGYRLVERANTIRLTDTGENGSNLAASGDNHVWMQQVGKKIAGGLLDGVRHHAMPEARA